jgi:maltooligosyltrehalose synthase
VRAAGARADQICAFVRRAGPQVALVAAAIFPARLESEAAWEGTTIPLTDDLRLAQWENVLTGVASGGEDEGLHAAEVFRDLPVAVFAGRTS